MSWFEDKEKRWGELGRGTSAPRGQEAGGLEEFCEQIEFKPDARQWEILRNGGRRVILNCTRQWGKSTVTAAKAVWEGVRRDGSLILVASPSGRQSAEFLRKAAGFVRRLGMKVKGDGDNEISLAFPNDSRIVGVPGKEETVRCYSAVRLMLIDEAARVPDRLYTAVKPMLAVGNGDLWLMSTPNGKQGFFYETWAGSRGSRGSRGRQGSGARGQGSGRRGLGDGGRGAGEEGDGWVRVAVAATECSRISKKFLEEERRTMPERMFRQEYMCEFTETEGAVFREEDIEGVLDYELEPL